MQTLGTALQLVGAIITAGALLYAWHITSGRLVQWGETIRTRLTQLRDTIAQLLRNIQTVRLPGIPSGEVFGKLTVAPEFEAELELVRAGTVEERLKWLENRHYTVLNQLSQQESRLRAEINQAAAHALDDFQRLSNAVRLRDIYPALAGILIGIIGMVCQLWPSLGGLCQLTAYFLL